MKVATWNIERLKHKKNLNDIVRLCNEQHADILVLTETDEQVRPDFKYGFHTPRLSAYPLDLSLPAYYAPTENRVSIYTNYQCVAQHETFDKHTALCVELSTELGNILVYGTIIGVLGNRSPKFNDELKCHVKDFKRLSHEGSLCICGDFNCSFCDNYYYTKLARSELKDVFDCASISLLTENQPECIDHIAVASSLIENADITVSEWNICKRLSDHKGIAVEVSCRWDYD